MKQANIQCFGLTYNGYYLIENLDDALEYEETIWSQKIKDSAQDIIHASKRNFIGHCSTQLGNLSHALSNLKGEGDLRVLCDLTGSVSASRLKYVCRGHKLAINHNGGYFLIPDDAKIERLEKYKYTEKDIKITKFEGGRHWYASVGGVEVVDETFGRRFNTYEYAYKKAIELMKRLNEKE